MPQVRRRYDRFPVGDRGRPRPGHTARTGWPNARGGRTDVRASRILIRPDGRDTARERTARVPGVCGHGVPVRGHAGRRRQLQRVQSQRRLRRLQRSEYN